MRKNKIRILHVAQAAGGVNRYIQMQNVLHSHPQMKFMEKTEEM